jgi:glycerol kinase
VNVVSEKKYIMSIDAGSTGIRAILFDKEATIIARHYEKTNPIHPESGAIEDDPKILWDALLSVVKNVLGQGYKAIDVAAIGISNQRGSFCLWEKESGKPVTNFISWADIRAAETANAMNKSGKWRMLKGLAKFISSFSSNVMMKTTSMFQFEPAQATVRLNWLLQKHPEFRARIKNGELLFGTLDTWFIYKLTGGKAHVTDFTNATSTALFNPFDLEWNKIYCNMFNLPMEGFPQVLETNALFGITDKKLFGAEIPIHGAAGDQQCALFGQQCFEPGDVKVSQGSGIFVDVTVGEKPKLSKRGLYPLIAWHIDGKPTYLIEGLVATAGTLIDWLGEGIGLSDTPTTLNEFAAQTEDTEGVIFVPTPAGIRFPFFDFNSRAAIFGLSLNTHRRHVARAVLEGLALRVHDIIKGIEQDTKTKIKSIKVDGGVSKSDIELQAMADFSNLVVNRAPEADMTATGAAFFAGLGVGFWKDQEELKSLKLGYTEFIPKMDAEKRGEKLKRWDKAVNAIRMIK